MATTTTTTIPTPQTTDRSSISRPTDYEASDGPLMTGGQPIAAHAAVAIDEADLDIERPHPRAEADCGRCGGYGWIQVPGSAPDEYGHSEPDIDPCPCTKPLPSVAHISPEPESDGLGFAAELVTATQVATCDAEPASPRTLEDLWDDIEAALLIREEIARSGGSIDDRATALAKWLDAWGAFGDGLDSLGPGQAARVRGGNLAYQRAPWAKRPGQVIVRETCRIEIVDAAEVVLKRKGVKYVG